MEKLIAKLYTTKKIYASLSSKLGIDLCILQRTLILYILIPTYYYISSIWNKKFLNNKNDYVRTEFTTYLTRLHDLVYGRLKEHMTVALTCSKSAYES